jgi:TorA maturation chaperone TorD
MSISNIDLIKNLAENRSRSYWLLSLFYLRKPDKVFIAELRRGVEKINVIPDLKEEILLLKDALKEDLSDQFILRLAVEFTRLFRGIKEGYSPPPPYESVYRGEGRVMGNYTLMVMKKYRDAGFLIIDKYPGPQDYIGTELKFMSFLCFK